MNLVHIYNFSKGCGHLLLGSLKNIHCESKLVFLKVDKTYSLTKNILNSADITFQKDLATYYLGLRGNNHCESKLLLLKVDKIYSLTRTNLNSTI